MATKNLAAVITIGGVVTSGLKAAFGSTKTSLQEIGKSITDLARKQRALGESIQTFGRMGRNVDTLRQRYMETTRAVDALRVAQTRLNTAQSTHDRTTGRAMKIGAAGAGMSVAGGVMLASVVPGVKEAKHYETEKARIAALGMGDKTNEQAFHFAKDMKTFGTSQLENLELLRDGMSVFADLHHAEMVAPTLAKMKFANKAMFGEEKGEENSKQFMDMLKVIETNGGLKSQAAFLEQANMIQQMISSTGGRVNATEFRHFNATGGLGVKGMSNEGKYFEAEHLIQEMGGDRAGTGANSLYKSLYQGVAKKRAVVNLGKLGLIGDESKVKHDKAGQTASMEPGALLGANLFRESQFQWMEKVLLPQLAKKGITSEKQIMDTMGMIVSNSVGGSYLAEMYRQREAIHKSVARNHGAQNIDQLDANAKGSTSGKELDAQAKLADLKLQLGKEILPLYARGLQLVTTALQSLNKFSADNPRLSKAILIGVTALGAALVTLGPILIAAAGAMGIYAGAQLMMTRLAVSQGATGAVILFGQALARLGGIIPGVMAVIRPLALAFMISAAPMWLVVGAGVALVAAGVAIYKYWEPLKAFFSEFGTAFMAGMAPVAEGFRAAFAPVWEVIGPVVMPVLRAVGDWVKSAVSWFGQLFTPIDQASKTTTAFGEAGKLCGTVIADAFTIMLKPITLVLEAIKWIHGNIGGVIDKVSNLMGGKGGVPGAAGDMEYDAMGNPTGMSAPALPNPAARGAAAPTKQENTFNITQKPGEDSEQLARRVAEHLKQQQGIRQRGAMTDAVGAQ